MPPIIKDTTVSILANPTEYRSMVLALQYLTMTRLDIAYAVHVVSQYMHATDSHAVKPIFRYLQGTLSFGLLLRLASTPLVIFAYSDADWAGCKDSCRSTTGYAVFFGPNLISWCSKKQPTVSKSSTEAEYRAVAYTVVETIWILKLLADLGLRLSSPTKVNNATPSLAERAIISAHETVEGIDSQLLA